MSYSATHILQLAIAFELIGLGFAAGTATNLVIDHWPKFQAAFGRVNVRDRAVKNEESATFVCLRSRPPVEPPKGFRDEATVDDRSSIFGDGFFANDNGSASSVVIDARKLFRSINRLAAEVGQEPYPAGSPEYRLWAEAWEKNAELFDNTEDGRIPF